MKNLKQKLRASAAFMIAAVIAGVAVNISNPQNINATTTSGCYDMEFIWARGSGSPMNAPEYQEFKNRIEQIMAGGGFNGVVNFYELGSATDGYPAQKVFEMTPEGFSVVLGAKISAGAEFAYGDSVKRGVNELQNYMNERLTSCPKTYFALGGYSQGAQVIGDALVKLPKEIDTQVVYSLLYGDPKLYLPEGEGLSPAACRGEDLSLYRGHVPKCQTSEGILGGRKPYLQPFQENKVATYCNAQDMICGSTNNILSWSGHTSYIQNGLFLDGAHRIMAAARVSMPALFLPDSVSHSPNTITPGQDVAILIDTTGSMDNQINEFSNTIQDVRRLAEQVLENNGRVALTEYRDTDSAFGGSAPSRVLCEFSSCNSIDHINNLLAGLTAEGGGDYDESMLHGVQNALENIRWREGASKALVIFTDAGFHDPDPTNGWSMVDAQRASIELNPVNIYIAKLFPGHSGDAALHHYTQLEQLTKLAELTTGEATDGISGRKAVSQMLSELARRPLARLSSTEYYAEPDQQITFDATSSTGVSAELAYADWDLDGDGVFETLGSSLGIESLRLVYSYNSVGSGYMQVRVVDGNGLTNTASSRYSISDNTNQLEPYLDMGLTAEKRIDEDGLAYAELSWTRLAVNAYQLYVNGVALGRLDWDVTNVKLYDLDFSRDNRIQLRAITYSTQLNESEEVWIYAENGLVNEEFDWSEALASMKHEEEPPLVPEEAKPAPEPEAPIIVDTPPHETGTDDTASPQLSNTGDPSGPKSPGFASLPDNDRATSARPIEVPDTSRLKTGFWHAWMVVAAWLLFVLLVLWRLVVTKKRR